MEAADKVQGEVKRRNGRDFNCNDCLQALCGLWILCLILRACPSIPLRVRVGSVKCHTQTSLTRSDEIISPPFPNHLHSHLLSLHTHPLPQEVAGEKKSFLENIIKGARKTLTIHAKFINPCLLSFSLFHGMTENCLRICNAFRLHFTF